MTIPEKSPEKLDFKRISNVIGILQATYPKMKFIGVPVPFLAGGVILLWLWFVPPHTIPKI